MRPDLYRNLADVESRHWWFRARRRIVTAVLEARLGEAEHPGGRRVLDVGAGTGFMTHALTRFGRVDALESAPEALRWLRDDPALRVLEGEVADADLPEAHYHVITALDVLEHISDDRSALASLARACAPGGHLLVTVPAHPGLWSEWDEANGHCRRYRVADLEARVGEVGFDVVFSSPLNALLLPLFVLDRKVRRRLRPEGADTLQVRVPPAPLNRVLEGVFALERHWLRRGWRNPVGSSHLLLGRRPG